MSYWSLEIKYRLKRPGGHVERLIPLFMASITEETLTTLMFIET